jgi:RNA polymerase sigma-70 factor (ECF subfamily)
MTTVHPGDPSSIRTRPSLLGRLKEGDDADAWQEFYRVYGKLVRDFAIRAGLTDAEADDVVQETAIGVARNLPGFSYDPKVCRFKTWLLNQTSWRIKNQLKRRSPPGPGAGRPESAGAAGSRAEADRTDTVERVADPGGLDLDAIFETEWRANLTALALEKVKERFSLKQIQMFDLVVMKEWPGGDVARALDVSLANVYVTKHRVAAALKREVQRLERAMEKKGKGGVLRDDCI